MVLLQMLVTLESLEAIVALISPVVLVGLFDVSRKIGLCGEGFPTVLIFAHLSSARSTIRL